MKNAARPGSPASRDERRLSATNVPSRPSIHSGAARRSIRPVTIPTAMITANMPSTGAGSMRTIPSSSRPITHAVS